MKPSKKQFTQDIAANKVKMTIIGMSNIGKTFWSKRLSERGFKHINCDQILEKKLEPELKKFGYKGLSEIAKWLGQPYEKQFKENEKIISELEKEITINILDDLENHDENIIIDTPGSIIYTGDEICSKLKDKTVIVYIESTPEMRAEMFENFLKNPKPIIWQNSYNKDAEENEYDSLARCYPELLAYRISKYEKYADLLIPYHTLRENMSAEEFLERLTQEL